MPESSLSTVPPRLYELFSQWATVPASTTEALPPSGSDRRYWRLSAGSISAIGSWNPNPSENRAFLAYARHFRALNHPVPEVYLADEQACVYLQQDLGSETLLQHLTRLRSENDGHIPHSVLALYRKALSALARLQVEGGRDLNYTVAFPRAAFDEQRMLWDLSYFKYCFLKFAAVDFDEQLLEDDFRRFVRFLLDDDCGYFLFRDFQSRNIMLLGDEPFFIDFQGGCRGALHYDVASLLFQAKADLPPHVRADLLDHYLAELQNHKPVDEAAFRTRFAGYVLLRQLQTLGAYGFRGLHERRAHFLESIPFALRNLAWVLDNLELPAELPELLRALRALPESAKLAPLLRPVTATAALTVRVLSFSYKKGLPADPSGNGGGFLFDCRGLNNPGRLEKYRHRTGNDAAVQAFLRKEAAVAAFLQHAQGAVDISLRTYLARGFSSLLVGFGCTGGQHRSVFCANELAAWLRRRYPVRVELVHRELRVRMHKALILAAGLGTRLRPLTDSRPKALVAVNGVPLLELQILRLKALGFDEVVVNVHHHADMVEEFLKERGGFGITVHISNERAALLDTGGAILKARRFLDGPAPFYVCNVDVLTDLNPRELAAAHARAGALATLAVRTRDTSRYLCFDEDARLCGWRNVTTGEVKGAPPDGAQLLAFSGLHVIDPRIFKFIDRDGKLSVIDLYLDFMGDHKIVAHVHDDSTWMDVGRPAHLSEAQGIAKAVLTQRA